MKNKNMSDMIEEYLKRAISEDGRIEIKRKELADIFDCVPSQINYVINTRFTIQHGYTVKSKRGGGGYIRIIKMEVKNDTEMIDRMCQIIGNRISEKEAQVIIQRLYENKFMTRREAQIVLASMEQTNFSGETVIDEKIRANILLSMIRQLVLKK